MNLDEVIKPLKNPKVVGSMIIGGLALSALLTYATVAIDKRYIESGGNTNAPTTNYEKLSYIINSTNRNR
ncbi:MAG: hypothetical protein WCK29_00855 [archaeon]